MQKKHISGGAAGQGQTPVEKMAGVELARLRLQERNKVFIVSVNPFGHREFGFHRASTKSSAQEVRKMGDAREFERHYLDLHDCPIAFEHSLFIFTTPAQENFAKAAFAEATKRFEPTEYSIIQSKSGKFVTQSKGMSMELFSLIKALSKNGTETVLLVGTSVNGLADTVKNEIAALMAGLGATKPEIKVSETLFKWMSEF